MTMIKYSLLRFLFLRHNFYTHSLNCLKIHHRKQSMPYWNKQNQRGFGFAVSVLCTHAHKRITRADKSTRTKFINHLEKQAEPFAKVGK